MGYLGALIMNFALRAIVFAPRPDDAMVAVAKANSDSGLPSTFALIYGSVLGVVVVARTQRAALGRWITFVALALIVAGGAARIVLGGHWPSQVVASLLLGFRMAYLLHEAARRVIVRASSNRQAPER